MVIIEILDRKLSSDETKEHQPSYTKYSALVRGQRYICWPQNCLAYANRVGCVTTTLGCWTRQTVSPGVGVEMNHVIGSFDGPFQAHCALYPLTCRLKVSLAVG